jgi:hypothetical protein
MLPPCVCRRERDLLSQPPVPSVPPTGDQSQCAFKGGCNEARWHVADLHADHKLLPEGEADISDLLSHVC